MVTKETFPSITARLHSRDFLLRLYQGGRIRTTPSRYFQKTVYYTPGQLRNCKWVIHTSGDLTTFPGDVTSIQIGIPEAAGHGYIEGVLENGPNSTLLLAFNLPGTTKKSPPIIMTSQI